MQYAWGYAAANEPVTSHLYRRPKPPPKASRSNSTRATPSTIKRTRIPGHSRASSSTESSRSKSSYEIPRYALHQGQDPQAQSGSPATGLTPGAQPGSNRPPVSPVPFSAAPATGSGGATAADWSLTGDVESQRERMLAQPHYPNNPQADSAEYHGTGADGSAVSDSSLTPRSPRPPNPLLNPRSPPSSAAAAAYFDRHMLQHAAMLPDPGSLSRYAGAGASPFARAESLSSATSVSRSTMVSSEQHSASDVSSSHHQRPFVVRNGRTFLSEPSLTYPLPVDLAELHRQSLRTLLMFQLFGGPVCSPAFANKPPTRVLEVGCGSGFWSMMCHRYYARHGHSSISFTGIDVAPIPVGSNSHRSSVSSSGLDPSNRTSTISTASTLNSDGRPDKDMKWRFVQHDMRRLPWPFVDGEFDLVMVKDMSLATPLHMQQPLIEEYIRLLRPGGTLELWESDHTIRMLRPHVPENSGGAAAANRDEDEDEHELAASLGAYVMTSNTPLSAPLNNFLLEYNGWLSRALETRNLSPVPCTTIGPMLVQEDAELTGLGSRRLAVPLSEVRWEREGVGGVVTKDGKSYVETTRSKAPAAAAAGGVGGGSAAGKDAAEARRSLTAGQSALRRTALLTVAQLMQSLEPLLREANGKSQDEWDSWLGKMMNDLMNENGTSWGECLEIGAWWARKKRN